MASTWLPSRRVLTQLAVTAVTCPRKGPLPSEISLLVCGHMHDTRPEKCAEQRCQKAIAFMPQLEQLRGIARATLRVFQDPPPPPRVDYDFDVRDGGVRDGGVRAGERV